VALIVLQADRTAPLHRTHPIRRSDYAAGNRAAERVLGRWFGHGRAGSLGDVHVSARVYLQAAAYGGIVMATRAQGARQVAHSVTGGAGGYRYVVRARIGLLRIQGGSCRVDVHGARQGCGRREEAVQRRASKL